MTREVLENEREIYTLIPLYIDILAALAGLGIVALYFMVN